MIIYPMKDYPPYFLCLLLLPALQVAAQESELFYNSISLQNLNDFKPAAGNWKLASDVYFDPMDEEANITSGEGILVNQPTREENSHLYTNIDHNDIELKLDFMMAKGSNAGVYLQGRYEIQMFDSWGVQNPKYYDCGGIYQRWDESRPEGRKGYQGHAPAQNVSKAPGLWQHYEIVFQAPRFNRDGEKVANARFVKVIHNGVVIHQNVELTGPTRSAAFQDEKALGPLMFQGDHGSFAVRNIRYKVYHGEQVLLNELKIKAYEGTFKGLPDFDTLAPPKQAAITVLQHQGTASEDNYAGSITGTMLIPRAGPYCLNLNLNWITDDPHFSENPNGAGELFVRKKKVLTIDGSKNSEATAVVALEAGAYPLQINYYKNRGNPTTGLTLTVEGHGIKRQVLKPFNTLPPVDAVGDIVLTVESDPILLQSFINHNGHKKTHTVSVGELANVNYSFDLSRGALLQIWRGNFVETTSMWHSRGHDQVAQQLGSVIEFSEKPSLAFLSDTNSVWPEANATYDYLGFDLDENDRPIFKYTLGDASVRESFEMEENGKKLSHSFKVVPGPEKKPIWCRIAEGSDIIKLPDGMYAVNDKQYFVELPAELNPVIRATSQNTEELLLPVEAKDQAASIKYSIVW